MPSIATYQSPLNINLSSEACNYLKYFVCTSRGFLDKKSEKVKREIWRMQPYNCWFVFRAV